MYSGQEEGLLTMRKRKLFNRTFESVPPQKENNAKSAESWATSAECAGERKSNRTHRSNRRGG